MLEQEEVQGPLHMSPVTGLARLPGRILWCVHMGNFSTVDQDEFKKQPKTLWTFVTLLINPFCILLKWKYIQDQNYTMLVAIWWKRSYFVENVSSRSPGWSVTGPVTEISGPLHMSPVTGLGRLPGRILWWVHMGNFSPVDRKKKKKHNQNGGT